MQVVATSRSHIFLLLVLHVVGKCSGGRGKAVVVVARVDASTVEH